MDILKLFCHVDDFCQWLVTWENVELLGVARKRGPTPRLSLREVMTMLIHFHQSHYRDFKAYCTQHVCKHMRSEFPALVSYTRFVELIPSALPAMRLYLRVRFGQRTGVAFIDSTPLSVCHNKRIGRQRVFAELARRGKSSMGWFYGFKLHLIVNDQGELLAVHLTPGNTYERKPVPQMTKKLWGKLIGDRGYLCQALFGQLFARGLQLMAVYLYTGLPWARAKSSCHRSSSIWGRTDLCGWSCNGRPRPDWIPILRYPCACTMQRAASISKMLSFRNRSLRLRATGRRRNWLIQCTYLYSRTTTHRANTSCGFSSMTSRP